MPRGDRAAPLVYKQGAHPPYAIRWYGATSLFGHFRNFIATAIASESVDSRDWMRPLSPQELLENALKTLNLDGTSAAELRRGPHQEAPGVNRETLLEAKGGPLWIDFVADTGDDRDVSSAVARMVFAEFVVRRGRGAT